MAKVYSTFVALQKDIEVRTSKAVKIASTRLLGKLQELINSEFYDQYDPTRYQRTFQFYDSAVTEMLTSLSAEIFMDASLMQYKNDWTGETQIEAANQGIHGGWYTEESLRHKYWDVFEDYCDKNAVPILREELRKQDLTIK